MSYFSPSGAGGIVTSTTLAPNGIVKSIFATAAAVAGGGTATVLSFTVPPAKSAYLLRLDISGQNIANYDLIVDGSTYARKRTWFGGSLSETLSLGSSAADAPAIASGVLIQVVVDNFRATVADFEARLQYIEG